MDTGGKAWFVTEWLLSRPAHTILPRSTRSVWLRAASRGLLVLLTTHLLGCGTSRWSDTQRTATEQLVISSAIDRAVSNLDFRALASKRVFFDPQYIDTNVDPGYLISSLRQHLLASGCLLQEDRERADYIVEARSGAIGTDRHDLLFGVPQLNLPVMLTGMPSQIPELPLAKKTNQVGVAKLAVFAYKRKTGEPVWQSGIVQQTSAAKNIWLLGAGPIQRGLDRDGTKFAGSQIEIPLFGDSGEEENHNGQEILPVTQETMWIQRAPSLKDPQQKSDVRGDTPDNGAARRPILGIWLKEQDEQ